MNTEQTTGQSSEGRQSEVRKSQTELQNRYGRIAISAVVAALPYGTDSKTLADTKAASKAESRN